MSEFERELVTLIRFKPNDYRDRQDYLAALARAADKWFAVKDKDQAIFDGLEDGLAAWFEEAITAMNHKDTIPEFPDRELEEPFVEAPEEEEADENTDAEEAEPQGAVAGASSPSEVVQPATTPDSETPKAAKKPKPEKSRYEMMSGVKDRYGCFIGTKLYDAVQMYERGTTAKELLEVLGGRYYNVLQRLKKDGHEVVPRPEGGFKVTHKADVEKRAKDAKDEEGE